ncbi:unnamed protein product [Blepharisma stoltei]|uniref:VPS9 domain-containing protein n=1 Tax=Blepharisma stoltei TaxID=1481888 RepID=A0AAU9J8T5_9CILI|nr:unnamed protein product [Blepharisma stoltei]
MGAQCSIDRKEKTRRRYFKIIRKQKELYLKKHQLAINTYNFKNWLKHMIRELKSLQEKFPEALWPQELVYLCKSWKRADLKWRSNVIWYNYLHSYKSNIPLPDKTVTNFKLPLPSTFQVDSLLDFIKTHLSHTEDHFISAMIFKFTDSFDKQDFPKYDIKPIIDEINDFVQLALQTLLNYYGGIVRDLIKKKDGDISDLILTYTISNKIHETALNTYLEMYKCEESKYQQNIEKFQYLKCKDFGIKELFQLDLHLENAYGASIDKLRDIEKVNSPIEKLNVITKAAVEICNCIDFIWKENDETTQDDLIIDSDQILSIFMYVVLKAKIKNLRGHVKMIYDFGRKEMQNGSMGYYVITLEACIQQIEMLENQEGFFE